MKKDIENRGDIEKLVDCFYEKVRADDMLGPVFTVQMAVDWDKHLPVMYRFWENAIFFTGGYTGNPMAVHARIHAMIGLQASQFERWLYLFNHTTDELFAGEKAELIKQRAYSIAKVMEEKILIKNS